MGAIRDLRELINVSRLTCRESDDEDMLYKDLYHDTKSKQTPMPKSSTNIPSKTIGYVNAQKDLILLSRTSIPKFSIKIQKPLPPVKDSCTNLESEQQAIRLSSSINELNLYRNMFNKPQVELLEEDNEEEPNEIVKGNFDELLTYIDASVISELLERSNRNLQKMYIWSEMDKCESFIKFANFWLTTLNDTQRRNLIDMEYSIVLEEVTQAFSVGLESDLIGLKDMHTLLRAVFKEYPLSLLSFRGLYMFLDYLDILCSDRQDSYKKLLSDVKCRTKNKQYAQWLLSIRSYALINISSEIVNFYQKTRNEPTVVDTLRAKSAPSGEQHPRVIIANNKSEPLQVPHNPTPTDLKYKYYRDACFKFDYADVLHYLILTKKFDPMFKDEHNRSLIFLAVINDKPNILSYLVKRWPKIDINEACDTGNTPLHAAVNNSNLKLVEILLRSTHIDINKINNNCMNASALHLAVWHNYEEIAILMVSNGANPYLKMDGGSDAIELARANSNEYLIDMLIEYTNRDK